MKFKYLIIGLYVSFVTLIIVMVVKGIGQKFDLETQNYYNEELVYQNKIDALKRGNAFADSFLFIKDAHFVHLNAPKSLLADSIVLNFKKPDNALYDLRNKFNGNHVYAIELKEFAKGIYNVEIMVYKDGEALIIPKKIML
jgi:hypothetical protein